MNPPPDLVAGPALPPILYLPKTILTLAASAGAVIAFSSTADAAVGTTSLPINFGSNEVNSSVDGAAGVLRTVNWNNPTGANGSATDLQLDLNSGIVGSTISVDWTSNGTWASTGRGEENNTATGEDRDLMAGYLDTGGLGQTGISITVTGLNSSSAFSLGYDVYVYIQGGVNGRGGTYTLGNVTNLHETTAAFDGTYIEDPALDFTTPQSNYIVFRNVTGDSFNLSSTPTIGNPARAPINAIEIVAVPEPSSFFLLGSAALLGLSFRRRKP